MKSTKTSFISTLMRYDLILPADKSRLRNYNSSIVSTVICLCFQLTWDYKCFKFTIEQHIEVEEAKPGYVSVYDYYETGMCALVVLSLL